jgi:hypothetical protein
MIKLTGCQNVASKNSNNYKRKLLRTWGTLPYVINFSPNKTQNYYFDIQKKISLSSFSRFEAIVVDIKTSKRLITKDFCIYVRYVFYKGDIKVYNFKSKP